MPALPSPGKVLKVQLVWTINASAGCMNVLHYNYSNGPPNAADLNAICTFIANALGTTQTVNLPASTALTGIIATDLAGTAGYQGAWSGNKPGTDPSAPASIATNCTLMNLHVQARYRGGHPRIYWPGMGENHALNGSQWQAASVSQFNSAFQTWLGAVNGHVQGTTTVGAQCVVSYYRNHAVRPTPVVLNVNTWTTNPGIASQRRRGAFA